MRGIPVLEKNVAVLYTKGLLNIAVYRLAVLTIFSRITMDYHEFVRGDFPSINQPGFINIATMYGWIKLHTDFIYDCIKCQ